MQQVNYGAGKQRSYGYDQAQRLTSVNNTISATESESYTYTYDGNSNRITEQRQINGETSRSVNYGYDNLDRLTSASYSAGTVNNTVGYTYDAVGNRLTESGTTATGVAVNRNYSYDELNRLTAITGDTGGDLAFSYDNNGNLLSQTQGGQTTSYSYDVRDQLRTVTGPTGQAVASFDYDFARKRISKNTQSGTLNYVYAGDQVVNEFSSTRSLVNRYDYGTDVIHGEIAGEGDRFYFGDGQGSVTALAGGSTATSRNEYDAWGGLISQGSSANQIGYTGQRRDSETGLMALGNGERYYASTFGRFIQQDSVFGGPDSPQTLNRYAYVNSNPVKYVDPDGHIAFLAALIPIAVGAAIGAMAGGAYSSIHQGLEILEGTRKWSDFSVTEVWKSELIGAGIGALLGGAALIPVVGEAIVLGAEIGFGGLGVYNGVQELRAGHPLTGIFDIAVAVVPFGGRKLPGRAGRFFRGAGPEAEPGVNVETPEATVGEPQKLLGDGGRGDQKLLEGRKEPLQLTAGESNESVWLDSGEIRQSQETISYAKKDENKIVKYTLDDIAEGYSKNPDHPDLSIDVVQMKDGGLTSRDNSRLAVRKATGGGPIKARIRGYDEPLTAAEMKNFIARRDGEFRTPRTWGEAVEVRIWKQSKNFRELYPNGADVIPRINGAPPDSIWSKYKEFSWKR